LKDIQGNGSRAEELHTLVSNGQVTVVLEGNILTATELLNLDAPLSADIALRTEEIPKGNNLTAQRPPTSADDSASGYEKGSIWLDNVTGTQYLCLSPAVNDAEWAAVSQNRFLLAARNPTTSDSSDAGFRAFDLWLNQANGNVYVCQDSFPSYARWRQVTARDAVTERFTVEGAVATGTAINGSWFPEFPGRITKVTAFRASTAGTGGSTIVDVNIDGTTIFTTQSNRPTIAYDSGTGKAVVEEATIESGTFAKDARITVDVDAIDTGGDPSDLDVVLHVQYDADETYLTPQMVESGYFLQRLVRGQIEDELSADNPHSILHIAINGSGDIIATSTFSGGLHRIDPDTGKTLESIDTLGVSTGVVVTSGGDIYVADFWAGEVYRYPSGAGPAETVATIDVGVDVLALNDSEDKLYVGSTYFSSGLVELDISTPASFPVAPTVKIADVADPNDWIFGIAFKPGSDTELYLSNGVSVFKTTDITAGSPAFSLVSDEVFPGMIGFHPIDGLLYGSTIIDFTTSEEALFSIDTSTNEVSVVASLPDWVGTTEGLTISAAGRVYLSGAEEGFIAYYTAASGWVAVRRRDLNSPAGVAVNNLADGQTLLYVQDYGKTVFIDGRRGKRLDKIPISTIIFDSNGDPVDEDIFQPTSIATNSAGTRILTTSWFDGRIKEYDSTTKEVVAEVYGDSSGAPMNADYLDASNWVVIEHGPPFDFSGPPEVRMYPMDGGASSLIDDSLTLPVGILVVPNTLGPDLYVSDRSGGTISRLMLNGSIIAPVTVVTGLTKPEGMCLDPLDATTAFVVEADLSGTGGRITRWNLSTGAKTTFMNQLKVGLRDPAPAGFAAWWQINDVATDVHGNVYVTTNQTDSLYAAKVLPNKSRDAIQ